MPLSLTNPDGALYHYLINADPIFDSNGAFNGYAGTFRSWSQLPFDQFRRGELLEARRREDAAQANEAVLRRESDALLQALEALTNQKTLHDKGKEIFAIFAPVLRFDQAAILRRGQGARMITAAASDEALLGIPWQEDATLAKAIGGEACLIAGDVIEATEISLPEALGVVRALMFVPLQIGSETAVMAIVSHDGHRFASRHLALMRRLSLLATKILQDEDQKSALITSAKLAATGELMATIVHELSQPISIISMSASNCRMLLERDMGIDRAIEKLHQISEATRRATETMQSVRALAFAEQSGAKPQTIRLADAVAPIETIARIGLQRKPIELLFDIPATIPPIVGHATWLQQILLNLITNARDAIDDKRRPNNAAPNDTIRVYARMHENAVLIGVADTGGGVPEDLHERIFNPFFTLKAMGKGTGLGLALCRRLVADMGGHITLRNENGGAVFEFTMPRAYATNNEGGIEGHAVAAIG